MNRYTLLFVGLGLTSTLSGAEDLGQKINSYALKDGKKVWEDDRFGNRTEFEYDRAGQLVNTRRSGMSVSGNVYSVCSIRHDFCGGCRDSAEGGRFCHA